MVEQSGETVNWTEDTLVFRFIQRAADAEAKGDIEAYFVYFKNAFFMMRNYLPIELQERLQRDYNKFEEILLEKNKLQNDQTRNEEILKLKKDFANSHEIFIGIALQHKGIQRPEADGEVDLEKTPPEKFSEIIRGSIANGIN